ncbi:MAG: FkbM family methyltransferase [Oscillatoria princeps RMCB-10]|jgi:FkbM family methyltransferase|nr:FkbM family methyltransferase [Oscillatoria princeps RMCB-10]
MFIPELLKTISVKLRNLSIKSEFYYADPAIFGEPSCFETIYALTRLYKPQYLLDIGAHSGRWAYSLHQLNPELKHVVFFEPQTCLQKKLQSLSLPGVSKAIYKCGLGEREEVLTLKGGSPSASFLDASEIQNQCFPNSILDESEQVKIKILDKIYERDKLPYPDLIKLDVQGFELNVLKGGINILSKSKYLVIELSYRQFYKEQPALWEVLKFLQDNNYTLVARGHEFRSGQNYVELLQMDGIFINTALVP